MKLGVTSRTHSPRPNSTDRAGRPIATKMGFRDSTNSPSVLRSPCHTNLEMRTMNPLSESRRLTAPSRCSKTPHRHVEADRRARAAPQRIDEASRRVSEFESNAREATEAACRCGTRPGGDAPARRGPLSHRQRSPADLHRAERQLRPARRCQVRSRLEVYLTRRVLDASTPRLARMAADDLAAGRRQRTS